MTKHADPLYVADLLWLLCCHSPIMLIQMLYKVLFLANTILPLALEGRWAAFPLMPTAVFSSYLPILVFCAPWRYLLGVEGADRGKAD